MTELLSDERLQEVLRHIPAEYEDIFLVTIRQEIADQGLADDMAILTYLRGRQAEFAGGAFLRPDGRPGLVTLGAGHELDGDLPLGDERGERAGRRDLIIRIAVLAVVAIALFAFLFGGSDDGNEVVAAAETPAAGAETATPEPIQELSGVNETLQGIGGLGGALQLGRPASIELHFSQTNEVVALPIDPSRTTPKGELRYNSGIMAGDNPVAVWLFGTVLNYAIGIPEAMVTRFVAGDQIVLQTDTGASFTFVVGSVESHPNYATNDLLRQDRVGMTLFALPATDETAVPVVLASYDIAQETVALARSDRFELATPFTLDGVTLEVTSVRYAQQLDGRLLATVTGRASGELAGKSILVGLTSRAEQTEAATVDLTSGAFVLQFSLPQTVQGAGVAADIRVFPSGQLATVSLGEAPRLIDQLAVSDPVATLDARAGLATIVVTVTHSFAGAVRLAPDFIALTLSATQGGENIPYALIDTQLPLLLEPTGTRVMAVTFVPPADGSAVLLTLGRTRWELAGFQ